MKYAWVKYKCGCCEGIWIDEKSKCIHCNTPVVEISNTVDLKPPEDFVLLIHKKNLHKEGTIMFLLQNIIERIKIWIIRTIEKNTPKSL